MVLLRCTLLGLALVCCAGCGASLRQNITELALIDDFTVELLPESLVGGASMAASKLDLLPVADGFVVSISIQQASDLKALYIKLSYDPSRYSPVSAKASNLLGQDRPRLELAQLEHPGIVIHGQVLCNWDRLPGYTGSGEAVVVRFKRQPFAPVIAVRQSSAAPAGDASATALSLDIANSTLNWRYYSAGDYDQNGVVGITDLTPLGIHFGEVGPFDIDTSRAVIDGNGNGAIDLSDLVIIGANFERRVAGYRVYESLNAGDYPGSNTAVSAIAWIGEANAALGDRAVERLSYSYTLAAVENDAFYWVRPYDGAPLDPAASEGTPSNLLDAGALTNEPPIADLVAYPAYGHAPLPVQFFAGGSADPDGTISQYEWDFDGDGTFEQVGFQNFATHVYDDAAEHIVTLRVTDNHGATGVDGVLVMTDLIEGWRLSLPVRDTYLDNIYAAAMIGDKPAVAFSSYNELRYCQATDTSARSWNSAVAIPQVPVLAGSMSLVAQGGRPAIAFANDSGQGPFYTRAADAAGTAWPEPTALVQPLLTDLYQTRIALAGGGNPLVVASVNADGAHSLQVILGTDLFGINWNAPIEADGGVAGFLMPALELINGLPALAYVNAGGAAIYSLSSGAPDGSNWVDETEIDPAILSGLCLAEVNGRPAVAYIKDPTHLNYIRADDAAGTSWLNVVEPEPGASLRFDVALANNAGVPVVAYVAVAAGGIDDELRFIRALDEDGALWEAPQIIGVFDRVGLLRLLELSDGRPALVFQVRYDVLDPGLHGDVLFCAVPE